MIERKDNSISEVMAVLEQDTVLPGSMPELLDMSDEAGTLFFALAGCAPQAAPAADLFDRIEGELDAPQLPGVETLHASSENWLDRGNGVWRKLMASVPDGKNIYMLRCNAGGVIPAHRHTGWEYALVLEGEFQIEGRTVKAGDAQISTANSDHPEITTDVGCLLLVVA